MQEIFERIGQTFQSLFQTIRLGSVNQLILCFALGAIIASIVAYYHKNYIGRLVRYLLRENANDPQSAKTLTDIGMQNNRLYRFSLRKKSTLRRIITVMDETTEHVPMTAQGTAKTAANALPSSNTSGLTGAENIAVCGLYIAPGKATERAMHSYANPGNGAKAIVLTVILVTVVAGLCIGFLPHILNLVSRTVEMFS